jgi:hypothetical protein
MIAPFTLWDGRSKHGIAAGAVAIRTNYGKPN